jgi:hypothetical protein
MDIDHSEVQSPRSQQNTGIPVKSDLAFCPTNVVDNFAPTTASPYVVTTQTVNRWTAFPNNTQSLPVMDFEILGDDPATWVWDGVLR